MSKQRYMFPDVVRYRKHPEAVGVVVSKDRTDAPGVRWVTQPSNGILLIDGYFTADRLERIGTVADLVALHDKLHESRAVIFKKEKRQKVREQQQPESGFQYQYQPLTPQEETPYYGH